MGRTPGTERRSSGMASGGGASVQSSVYGNFGRSQSLPRTDLERGLAQAQARVAALERQLSELRFLIGVIEAAKPEALPESIALDPRYRQLKERYEEAILNEVEDIPETKKAVEASLRKLKIWVSKILLPEQHGAFELATLNHRRAQAEAAELEAKVKDEATKREAELRMQETQTLKALQDTESARIESTKGRLGEPRLKQAQEGQSPQDPSAAPPSAAPTPRP